MYEVFTGAKAKRSNMQIVGVVAHGRLSSKPSIGSRNSPRGQCDMQTQYHGRPFEISRRPVYGSLQKEQINIHKDTIHLTDTVQGH